MAEEWTSAEEWTDYPVKSFDGTKSVVISTVSWIGGKQPFLGWAYIAAAILCVALAIGGLVRHLIKPRKLGDMSRESDRILHKLFGADRASPLLESGTDKVGRSQQVVRRGMYGYAKDAASQRLIPHRDAPSWPVSLSPHGVPPTRGHYEKVSGAKDRLHGVWPYLLSERRIFGLQLGAVVPVAEQRKGGSVAHVFRRDVMFWI